jgi:hypothetical protein
MSGAAERPLPRLVSHLSNLNQNENMKDNVLSAIEGERVYQEQKWPGHKHTVAEWLLIMEKLMTDARKAWVTGHGDNQALHEVRQVVATGVACLEQCGAPSRGQPVTGRTYKNEGGLIAETGWDAEHAQDRQRARLDG